MLVFSALHDKSKNNKNPKINKAQRAPLLQLRKKTEKEERKKNKKEITRTIDSSSVPAPSIKGFKKYRRDFP